MKESEVKIRFQLSESTELAEKFDQEAGETLALELNKYLELTKSVRKVKFSMGAKKCNLYNADHITEKEIYCAINSWKSGYTKTKGFLRVPNIILELGILVGQELGLYLYLAHHKPGTAIRGTQITEVLKLSNPQNHIRSLMEKGFVVRYESKSKSGDKYKICHPSQWKVPKKVKENESFIAFCDSVTEPEEYHI